MKFREAGKLFGVSALAVTLFLGVACSEDDGDTGAVPTLPANSDAVPTEVTGAGSSSEADFSIQVQDELTQLQNELNELETKAAALDEAARAEVQPMIADLRTTITTLENRLVDLQATPDGPDREAVKAEIEDTLELAQTQVDELQAAVGI
ncbi:MAG TPA: hypothetical protein VFS30_13230 [Dehalococcoidia bacterium]|nr:hypothetical protein [Dehalococcoidia bacterium]